MKSTDSNVPFVRVDDANENGRSVSCRDVSTTHLGGPGLVSLGAWGMRFVVLFWGVVTLGGCQRGPSDTDPADRELCERFREHVVDLRLSNVSDVDVRQHRALMIDAFGERFIDACTSSMTAAQVKCAVDAASSEDAETCTRQKPAS
jgi:hypothetical protein